MLLGKGYDVFGMPNLSNHESCLRPERFVTRKIIEAARNIAKGSDERLVLGNTKIIRDWGWAPEYVDAMWRMLQQDMPDDYVIATEVSVSLEHFVELAFENFDLDWHQYVDICEDYYRPTDLAVSRANPQKAATRLGWKAKSDVADVVKFVLNGEI